MVNDVCLEDTETLKEKSKAETVKTERGDSDSENNENGNQKIQAEKSLSLCEETEKYRRNTQPQEAEENKKEIKNNSDGEFFEEEDSFVSARGDNDLVMNGSLTKFFRNECEANNSLNYKAIDSKSEVKTNVSGVSLVANEEASSHALEVSENDIDLPLEETLANENKKFAELTSDEHAENDINHTKKTETLFRTEHISIECDDNTIRNIDKDSARDCQEVEENELTDSPAKNIDLCSNSQKFIDAESVPENSAAIETKFDKTVICSAAHKEGESNDSCFQNRDKDIAEVLSLENQESAQSVIGATINKAAISSATQKEEESNIPYFQNRDNDITEVVPLENQESKQTAIEAKFDKAAICSATDKEAPSTNSYFENRDNDITDIVQPENQEPKPSVADFLFNEMSNQSVSTPSTSGISMDTDSNQCCSTIDENSSHTVTPLHNVVTQQMVDEEERYEEEDKVEAQQHRNVVSFNNFCYSYMNRTIQFASCAKRVTTVVKSLTQISNNCFHNNSEKTCKSLIFRTGLHSLTLFSCPLTLGKILQSVMPLKDS